MRHRPAKPRYTRCPRRNPIVYREGRPTPAEGHFVAPETLRANELAARVVLASRGTAKPKSLGRGHFGQAYLVHDAHGRPWVVKVAAAKNRHGTPWTPEEARDKLLREAAAANTLRALGLSIIPEIHYTEVGAGGDGGHGGGGKPALVREYGEPTTHTRRVAGPPLRSAGPAWGAPMLSLRPVQSTVRNKRVQGPGGPLTAREYLDLERQLLAVVDAGWTVRDDLQPLRRPDGSVFIGDVGEWEPTEPNGREGALDELDTLLGLLGERLSLTLTAAGVAQRLDYAEREVQHYLRDPDEFNLTSCTEAIERVEEMARKRERSGFPLPTALVARPAELRAAVEERRARAVVERAEAEARWYREQEEHRAWRAKEAEKSRAAAAERARRKAERAARCAPKKPVGPQ